MPLAPADRAAFLAMMPNLGPDGDPDELVSFVRDHFYECLEELGAEPGFDQVRCGLVRLMPRVLAPEERREALSGASRALDAYPAAVAEGDPTLLYARNPAWVGLCALELGEQLPSDFVGGLDRAVALATAGYALLPADAPVGRGEVVWAMAEAASECGWTDRAAALLEAATRSPFADPENGWRVRLLLGQARLEGGDEAGARDVLEDVAVAAEADVQTRTHARWIVAMLARDAGEVEAAREWLREALREAVADGEDEAAEHIKAALGELDEE